MLVLVIGLFVLTAVGAEPPDLVGEWLMTPYVVWGKAESAPSGFSMTFFENGTGFGFKWPDQFLWQWGASNQNILILTNAQFQAHVSISLIHDEEFFYFWSAQYWGYPLDDKELITGIFERVGQQ